MADLKLVSVSPMPDYHLLLQFENGEKRIFDVNPYIRGAWFGKLKENEYFGLVHIIGEGEGIEWPEGQDIAPHELRELSILADQKLPEADIQRAREILEQQHE